MVVPELLKYLVPEQKPFSDCCVCIACGLGTLLIPNKAEFKAASALLDHCYLALTTKGGKPHAVYILISSAVHVESVQPSQSNPQQQPINCYILL